MGKYNFDSATDRRNSDAIKYCELQKRFGKADLLPAWVADMDFDVCPDIWEALTRRINHHIYGYSTVPDSYFEAIISWVDRRYGMKVSREEISYIPGVVKGIAFAINHFSAKGDKIVIQQPVYHPFRMVIEGNGRVVVNSPLLKTDTGYTMDLEGLRHVIETEHPTMMILCNPHNPIGLQWSKETLAEVAHICAQNGVVVVSDEIHGDLTLYSEPHIPFLEVSDEAREIGVMLGAPSKTFNIPGLVSSWCVIKNPKMRRSFFNWLTNNEFNDPTFMAVLAAEVAYTTGEQWLGEALEYITANIEHLAAELPKVSGGLIDSVKPEASFLLWLDCRKMGLTQAELVDFFINKAGLALNDGSMFGVEGNGYMRFNAAAPRATIDQALKQIADAIANFKK